MKIFRSGSLDSGDVESVKQESDKSESKKIKQRLGRSKGKRKKIIAAALIICLVIATVGNAITKQNKTKASESKAISATVGTGTIKESVSGTGTISYAGTTDIQVPSDLEMDEILVSEGTYVEKGTLLATVDKTSLAVCIADVEEAISGLDSTITSELSSSTTQYVTAGVSGTVEKIYGSIGDSVEDIMVENGALMLVKNGDETIKVIGSDGTITSVNVSEGSSVSASTRVFTIDSDAQSGEYLQAVKDREELVSILETLISIKKNGGITAGVEGMVETINVSGSASDNNTSAEAMTGGTKNSAGVEDAKDDSQGCIMTAANNLSEASDNMISDKDHSITDDVDASDTDSSVHSISAVTITNLAAPSVTSKTLASANNTVLKDSTTSSDTLAHNSDTPYDTRLSVSDVNIYGASVLPSVSEEKLKLLEEIKAGVGCIEGTTKEMEYADKEDAADWTECTDDHTEAGIGVWYVRYKETLTTAASSAVKVEVKEASEETNTSVKAGTDNEQPGQSGASSNNGQSGQNDKGSSSDRASQGNAGSDGSQSGQSNSDVITDSTGSSTTASTGSGTTGGKASAGGTNSNTSGGSTDSTTGKSSTSSTSTGSSSVSGSSTTDSAKSDSSTGASSSKSSTGSSSGKSSSSGGTSSKGSSSGSSSGGSSGSSNGGTSQVSTISAFTIADGDKMKVTMNVDELDILTMKEGLSAEITLDAVENKTFEGTITAVSGSASGSNGSTQYPVEITFDKTDEMLSGMNASVAVIIEEAENVLTVPLAAISDEGRSSYVYTGYDEASGELTGKTEVTLGMSDDNKVEIKEGLSEGDTIYYEMQGSQDSDSRSSRGVNGMGMPGMSGQGDMKMGGDRPSGENGGGRPSGDGSGKSSGGGKGSGSGGPGKQQ
ncbi:MAG: HlyD family efflux transporter periplasmic adaptor subunit [Lachnospiraceae bacterium]|nr:HlyD family efflux transporter periplasmic adaptor subunit [Lachnospiraceae bacterium]